VLLSEGGVVVYSLGFKFFRITYWDIIWKRTVSGGKPDSVDIIGLCITLYENHDLTGCRSSNINYEIMKTDLSSGLVLQHWPDPTYE
jgi:hypothetical protein